MSLTQQLHEAVETLSEPMTLEDAVERVYHAFRLKQGDRRVVRLAGALRSEVPSAGDPIADALAEVRRERAGRLDDLLRSSWLQRRAGSQA
jgi:hypothetical protein